jgi:mercuric ion transport protein
VKVEVLYLKGCPNHEPAVEQVQKALRSEGLPILVNEVELTDPAMAQEVGFLGSPSIRIDGIDVGPGAREVKTFGFSCRTYSDDEGRRSGLPQSASSNRRRVKAEARELKTNKQFGVSCSRRRCRRPRIFLLPGPLILVVMGFSGAWIGSLSALEPYRPLFLGFTLIALLLAGFRIFRRAKDCDVDGACSTPHTRRTQKFIFSVVALLAVVAFAFPHLERFFY